MVLLDSVEPHLSNKPSYVLLWQSLSESLQSKENILHRFTFPPIVVCVQMTVSPIYIKILTFSLFYNAEGCPDLKYAKF